MRRSFGGYTIIEVMIFLAVSSAMLVYAIVSVRGQQAHTEFITTMNELNSNIQQWIDEVVNGYSASQASPLSSDFKCTVASASSPPIITRTAPGAGNALGANPDCVFLGKAIQINTDQNTPNHIYVYNVLGRRTYINGGIESLADNIKHSLPAAAYNSTETPPIDLTNDFTIPNGVRVTSVSGSPNADSHLLGIYTGFNGVQSGGASSLLTLQYPFTENKAKNDSQVISCLSLQAPCDATSLPDDNPWPMNTWKLCFNNTRNDEYGMITISSSTGFGASTQLVIEKGPTTCS
jgi:type II secretory pathway pseudopilin PulG